MYTPYRNDEDDFYEIFLLDDVYQCTFQYIKVWPEEKFTIPDEYSGGEWMPEFFRMELDQFKYRFRRGVTYSIKGYKILEYLLDGVVILTEFFPVHYCEKGFHPFVFFSIGRYIVDKGERLFLDANGIEWGYADMYGDIIYPSYWNDVTYELSATYFFNFHRFHLIDRKSS